MSDKKPKKKLPRKRIEKEIVGSAYLLEVAWEVCNQVGGIYTVIRSKVPQMIEAWDDRYCLLGPYFPKMALAEFEYAEIGDDAVSKAVKRMWDRGFQVHYGNWLITGKPRVVLFDVFSIYNRLNEIKFELWDHHQIPSPDNDDLLHQVECFGYMVREFFTEMAREDVTNDKIVAHFHEWMAATAIPGIRRRQLKVTTVFTTHATMLGRYLAMNDPLFYEYLPFYDWQKEAKHFNIESAVVIERAAAHGSHVFTTVSEVTGQECIHLLGRKPDLMLPNGLNIERFTALHEFQNLHLEFKLKIHRFVMGHFFHSYPFDLDNTLYFFTSGRYEYRNKGFDITLEALARLNFKMQQANIDKTIVMFIVTKRPFSTINPMVLQTRAVMEELAETCKAIEKQVGDKLFYAAAASNSPQLPNMNDYVEDYWRFRYRRTLQSWKTKITPIVTTHNLLDDRNDEVLNQIRATGLVNNPTDKVKIVYHPDFISPTNPLFGMEYHQFVRGCHLGIFPSYYEPWGYTPLECMASGVPAVTSDLAGFGDYVQNIMPDHEERGVYINHRLHKNFNDSANELAEQLFNFVQQSRRERIMQRNRVESSSTAFDWKQLVTYYDRAHQLALERLI